VALHWGGGRKEERGSKGRIWKDDPIVLIVQFKCLRI